MGLLTLLLMACVPLLGGDLRRLAALQLRHTGLLTLALALQILVITIAPGLPRPVTVGAHLLSYALAASFLVANRHHRGLVLVGAGAALNGGAIALNQGTLPASPEALARAGVQVDPDVFTNSGVLPDPVLPWLGDVFAVPAGFPFANVFSVGDVVILLGAAWIVLGTCLRSPRSRAVRPRTGTQDPLLALSKQELVDLLEQAWADRCLHGTAAQVPTPRPTSTGASPAR